MDLKGLYWRDGAYALGWRSGFFKLCSSGEIVVMDEIRELE